MLVTEKTAAGRFGRGWRFGLLLGLILVVVAIAGVSLRHTGTSATPIAEPACLPLQDGATSGCIAEFQLDGVSFIEGFGIALTADAKTLVVLNRVEGTNGSISNELVGFDAINGNRIWQLPTNAPVHGIGISPEGERAALWRIGQENSVAIVELPGGEAVAEIPTVVGDEYLSDLSFSADGSSLTLGARSSRQVYQISNGEFTASPSAEFGSNSCRGAVGRSLVGSVTSTDNQLTVVLRNNDYGYGEGQIISEKLLEETICDTSALGSYMFFSQDSDRLAVINTILGDDPSSDASVVEVWDTSLRSQAVADPLHPVSLKRLAAFPSEMANPRMGWSTSGKSLAVIYPTAEGLKARIYAVP